MCAHMYMRISVCMEMLYALTYNVDVDRACIRNRRRLFHQQGLKWRTPATLQPMDAAAPPPAPPSPSQKAFHARSRFDITHHTLGILMLVLPQVGGSAPVLPLLQLLQGPRKAASTVSVGSYCLLASLSALAVSWNCLVAVGGG